MWSLRLDVRNHYETKLGQIGSGVGLGVDYMLFPVSRRKGWLVQLQRGPGDFEKGVRFQVSTRGRMKLPHEFF